METLRVKPCAVNSTRLVQWRKSRPPIFDRTPGTESASRDPATRPLRGGFHYAAVAAAQSHSRARRILHRGCTGNAESGRRRSCVICAWRFAPRRILSECCRSVFPAGCRLSDGDQTPEALSESFQDGQSTLTQSSVTVLRDLRRRMDVRFAKAGTTARRSLL